jgi:5-methylcytosine-specific restriction endonuclease McrA
MKEKIVIKECKHHGKTEYILEPSRDSYRCKKCRSENVTKRRKKVKVKLVKEFGGKCKICNYGKYIGALDFHHLNPTEKSFALSCEGITRSYNKALEEAKKCILVCSNCHREIEAGLINFEGK